MSLVDYINDTAKEMRRRSEAIRRDFAMHKGAAGDNREDLVVKFLADHLPNGSAFDTASLSHWMTGSQNRLTSWS